MVRSAFKLGLGALILGGAIASWSAPAAAGASTGTWANGMQAGPYGIGWYHPDGSFTPPRSRRSMGYRPVYRAYNYRPRYYEQRYYAPRRYYYGW